MGANNFVIEEAAKYGIRSYVFVPCIVCKLPTSRRVIEFVTWVLMSSIADGEGEGFGNRTSIQTVAIVRAAEAAKRVYRVDTGRPVGAHLSNAFDCEALTRLDLACMPCP